MIYRTYIVHNDWVEDPFIRTDDFNVAFSIKDYNEMKRVKKLTKDIDFFEELEKFKDWKHSHYDYYKKEENIKEFLLKTKWTIVTYDGEPIALTSEAGVCAFNRDEETYRYSKLRVKTLEEGLEYLKM